ncbi:hypothetical protein AF335_21205 [Streptomyces eurocidicus]|uniref:Uncharacterized protein n=1 Tax=Streptomyces eurocidicus TaxID=66423 RepID=A0A2N8NTY8_STREU|nr:hypothetical protein [Streptomyces eurocidicus]MBB5119295.1 hypothetical protein [Streptomyces eurocidicus]MBF6053121.1 hypothetical protein [Streptomyces eurocidicus]PNE32225.1 hypothetical protein AF335_21205 [Streptomyces eurocidicus]
MWEARSLFLQFTIRRDKLDERLFGVGTRTSVLKEGEVAIGENEVYEVVWDLGTGRMGGRHRVVCVGKKQNP